MFVNITTDYSVYAGARDRANAIPVGSTSERLEENGQGVLSFNIARSVTVRAIGVASVF